MKIDLKFLGKQITLPNNSSSRALLKYMRQLQSKNQFKILGQIIQCLIAFDFHEEAYKYAFFIQEDLPIKKIFKSDLMYQIKDDEQSISMFNKLAIDYEQRNLDITDVDARVIYDRLTNLYYRNNEIQKALSITEQVRKGLVKYEIKFKKLVYLNDMNRTQEVEKCLILLRRDLLIPKEFYDGQIQLEDYILKIKNSGYIRKNEQAL